MVRCGWRWLELVGCGWGWLDVVEKRNKKGKKTVNKGIKASKMN